MKLKRLVSAILAVGMALTMLPTAAFAADTSKYVTDLNFQWSTRFGRQNHRGVKFFFSCKSDL